MLSTCHCRLSCWIAKIWSLWNVSTCTYANNRLRSIVIRERRAISSRNSLRREASVSSIINSCQTEVYVCGTVHSVYNRSHHITFTSSFYFLKPDLLFYYWEPFSLLFPCLEDCEAGYFVLLSCLHFFSTFILKRFSSMTSDSQIVEVDIT